MTKIKYIYNYPPAMFGGGTVKLIDTVVSKLRDRGYKIEFLDLTNSSTEFDVLIFFGCTFYDPQLFEYYKKNGVKIINIPIFDRLKPLWIMKLFKLFLKIPVLNLYRLRKAIFESCDVIIASNQSEKRDICEIYNINKEKIVVAHLGISEEVFELSDTIDRSLFVEKYGLSDFVFCPAVMINEQKNQINLLKAVIGTDIKLVINNTHNIQKGLENEFWTLAQNNPNVTCLERLSFEELISCFKAAKLSVSVSKGETAGFVNLEAAYHGCKLVVSDLEVYHEYLQDYPTFVNQYKPQSIRNGIMKALEKEYNPSVRDYVRENFSWDNYISTLELYFPK